MGGALAHNPHQWLQAHATRHESIVVVRAAPSWKDKTRNEECAVFCIGLKIQGLMASPIDGLAFDFALSRKGGRKETGAVVAVAPRHWREEPKCQGLYVARLHALTHRSV